MNVALTRTADDLPRRPFTAEDIWRMNEAGILNEDERFELIEGDLIMMAAKGIAHENIKHALNLAFAKAVPENIYVAIESTLQLTDHILVEPDLALVSRALYARDVTGYAKPRAQDILLLVEIAASRMNYDRGVKARLYARHRIQEFWVIDANERVTWAHTGPQDDHWNSIIERAPHQILTSPALPGFAIQLSSIS